MKRWNQASPALVGLGVLIAALVAGCRPKGSAPVAARPLSTASVRVQPAVSQRAQATEEVVGTVRARSRANIEAKVSGRIEQLPVVVGQPVKQGELLIELDAREIRAKLDQATALQEQAQRDLQRFAALLKQEAVTQAEYDAVDARKRVTEAALAEAQTMLGYTRIVAPFAGVITRKLADVGDLATPGRPLLEIEDPATLRFEADVPETMVRATQTGARWPLRLGAQARAVEGAVSEIAPTADPVSRTFRVKLDLPPNAGVMAGEFGRALVPVAESNLLRVPAAAVVVRGQLEIVFVVTNQVAQLRLVKTGKASGDQIELLSGVDAGESVVTEGAASLLDGQPVQVRP